MESFEGLYIYYNIYILLIDYLAFSFLYMVNLYLCWAHIGQAVNLFTA